MKAVRLTVKGFGPYVEEQEVDFRQLKDAALYLITGPTGSGKTTLLDAICFSLYGDTSGVPVAQPSGRAGGDRPWRRRRAAV